MVNEIIRRSSLQSMRSTFLKYANRTSGTDRESFLAMYKAVTIIFSEPLNLEAKVAEYQNLNNQCIETLKKYCDHDENLQIYLELFEFNVEHVEGSRSLSA